MGPRRQLSGAVVPARAPGRPAVRHPGLPPRRRSRRRDHRLHRRRGDRDLEPVRRRASRRAAVGQRRACRGRAPAASAHRRLRARRRPGLCPPGRMPGPGPAPRLDTQFRTVTAPRERIGVLFIWRRSAASGGLAVAISAATCTLVRAELITLRGTHLPAFGILIDAPMSCQGIRVTFSWSRFWVPKGWRTGQFAGLRTRQGWAAPG